ncbi:mannose-1-phosphate guanylyltransferase/mannose-6-phosphate isomerase [Frigidibacter sp. MR17.24]|uniref:mannose-1-phosphate guanylyltransferase/mannose-6-phosphate isomerase n=1 Tax=Frigidibacter sp. MR17.24 TaxID=3127345 RepID=UPI003012CFE9
MITPVILCGGSGTRLWPLSRKAYPKQFLPLTGSETLFQGTLRRLSGEGFDAPLVLTGEDFRFIATDQAQAIGLDDAKVVIEPSPRDTAAAVLTAALMHEDRPEQMLLVAPSDHVIGDPDSFRAAVRAGALAAAEGSLVTFGIAPTRPETGYGYLELAEPAALGRPVPLESFREKPDAATAAEFLAAGRYLWNAGIFLARAGDLIAAFERHAPELVAPVRSAISGGVEDLGFLRLETKQWGRAPSISFDYAVMEKAANVAAVPVDCGWNDLGSWDALIEPGQDVTTHGAVTAIDVTGSYLRSEEPGVHMVGLGLKDVVAVATRDAVLIADRSRLQEVKTAVALLKQAGAPQAEDYPRFHRPWGWYETLCLGTRFQVKRIMVKSGGILSLQSHMHRSEHWIVVAGTAEVTIGDQVQLVTENQSVYIPLGEKHRMANPGKVPMYLIEVQTGAYVGEDDIVRYEDIYHRA